MAEEKKDKAVAPKRVMMTGSEPANPDAPDMQAEEPAKTAPSASKLKIEPLSKPEDLKPETDKKTEAEPVAEENDSDDSDDDGGGRDKLKEVSQDEQNLIDKKAAERQANFDKIALAKTYYLPINQVVRRRSKHVVIAGTVLAILLGLAWLGVALDAGLITIPGVKAPTHFFN